MNKRTLFAIAAGIVIVFAMITAIMTTYRPTVHHEKTNQLRPKPSLIRQPLVAPIRLSLRWTV
jgi:thermitase